MLARTRDANGLASSGFVWGGITIRMFHCLWDVRVSRCLCVRYVVYCKPSPSRMSFRTEWFSLMSGVRSVDIFTYRLVAR